MAMSGNGNPGVLLTEQLIRSLERVPRAATEVHRASSKRRRVGIDARVFCFDTSMERGIGHYTLNHLETVIRQRPDWEFVLFLDTKGSNAYISRFLAFPNVTSCTYDKPVPVDLFHIPDLMSMVPGFDSAFRLAPRDVPISVVFYDLIPLVRRAEHYDCWSQLTQIAFRKRLQGLAASNVLVLAISEFTRSDLTRHVPIEPDRVVPIMAGLNHLDRRDALPSEAEAEQVIRRLKIPQPYFLAVGGLDPHKNFITTLHAFQHLPPERKANLIVVGGFNDPRKRLIEERLRELGIQGVRFTGYLSNDDLVALYRAAQGLVFPSAYEGFGFPALEGMAFGCPVICSNAASIPEVVGDAALIHDPQDIEGVARSMLRLLDDSSLRRDLIAKGLKRSELFSWERTAEATISAWDRFLQREPVMSEKSCAL